MLVPITALFAVLLTLIMTYLSFRVGAMRGKTGISIFYGDNQALALEMRRHANFVEFVPMALLLMAIVELNGGSSTLLYGVGALLVVARICHPIGLKADSIQSPLRGLGAGGTLLATLILMVAAGWQLIG